MKIVALCSGPTARVFVHPSHRKLACLRQLFPIPMAMQGLRRGCASLIKGDAYHEDLHTPFPDYGHQPAQILREGPPRQGRQRSDCESQGITTGQANPSTTDIQSQYRSCGRWSFGCWMQRLSPGQLPMEGGHAAQRGVSGVGIGRLRGCSCSSIAPRPRAACRLGSCWA